MAFPATYITVDEYLNASYSPDCDYVDGTIEERSLGERPHSSVQGALIFLLYRFRELHGIRIYPEQRVQTQLRRFRIPDVCVTLGKSEEFVFRFPPFLCIEILSSEDRLNRIEKRAQEYVEMGVSNVWIIDPVAHRAWTLSASGLSEVVSGVLTTPDPLLAVTLTELWELAED